MAGGESPCPACPQGEAQCTCGTSVLSPGGFLDVSPRAACAPATQGELRAVQGQGARALPDRRSGGLSPEPSERASHLGRDLHPGASGPPSLGVLMVPLSPVSSPRARP